MAELERDQSLSPLVKISSWPPPPLGSPLPWGVSRSGEAEAIIEEEKYGLGELLSSSDCLQHLHQQP